MKRRDRSSQEAWGAEVLNSQDLTTATIITHPKVASVVVDFDKQRILEFDLLKVLEIRLSRRLQTFFFRLVQLLPAWIRDPGGWLLGQFQSFFCASTRGWPDFSYRFMLIFLYGDQRRHGFSLKGWEKGAFKGRVRILVPDSQEGEEQREGGGEGEGEEQREEGGEGEEEQVEGEREEELEEGEREPPQMKKVSGETLLQVYDSAFKCIGEHLSHAGNASLPLQFFNCVLQAVEASMLLEERACEHGDPEALLDSEGLSTNGVRGMFLGFYDRSTQVESEARTRTDVAAERKHASHPMSVFFSNRVLPPEVETYAHYGQVEEARVLSSDNKALLLASNRQNKTLLRCDPPVLGVWRRSYLTSQAAVDGKIALLDYMKAQPGDVAPDLVQLSAGWLARKFSSITPAAVSTSQKRTFVGLDEAQRLENNVHVDEYVKIERPGRNKRSARRH